eukprot:2232570-Rhodomonas_salina.1
MVPHESRHDHSGRESHLILLITSIVNNLLTLVRHAFASFVPFVTLFASPPPHGNPDSLNTHHHHEARGIQFQFSPLKHHSSNIHYHIGLAQPAQVPMINMPSSEEPRQLLLDENASFQSTRAWFSWKSRYAVFSVFGMNTIGGVVALNGAFCALGLNQLFSVLSINAFGSLLSINSSFSILSTGSAFSIGCADKAFEICF